MEENTSSFVHECNKNNRNDTKRDKSAWHNKILTDFSLFVNVKKCLKRTSIFKSSKSLANQPNPMLRVKFENANILFSEKN